MLVIILLWTKLNKNKLNYPISNSFTVWVLPIQMELVKAFSYASILHPRHCYHA